MFAAVFSRFFLGFIDLFGVFQSFSMGVLPVFLNGFSMVGFCWVSRGFLCFVWVFYFVSVSFFEVSFQPPTHMCFRDVQRDSGRFE